MRRLSSALAVAAFVCVPRLGRAQAAPPAPAPAARPADAQSITVGAVVFYDYTFTNAPKTTDAAGQTIKANAFNVTRSYVNVTGRVSSIVSFRITPDITRESGSGGTLDGSMSFRLKYGYAQLTLDQFTGAWRNTWVRLGMQQTPLIDSQEGVYRYRFQGTPFAERDGGLVSADTGITFHTDLPGGYGDVHVGVYNGEGYTRAEANDQKALMLRGTIRPMPQGGPLTRGLRVTGYVHKDEVVAGAPRNRYAVGALYEHARFNAGVDYMARKDASLPTDRQIESSGYSFFVTPFFKQKGNGFEALIRHDVFRPDTDTPDARQRRTIAGLAYWFPHPGGNATAALMLDFEQVRFRNFATPQARQERVLLHGLISF